ncbi:CLUMA_CG019235, isoform A [Clunio marinus]|uniref:CLUMA_CG019235, isoform A n=1 Tax=Clunio marinus TaxID=568069 RepID=A0A1J1J2X2_9DIPT|nr:CLUMA_CG019235, isoform A [Clunio marinus]
MDGKCYLEGAIRITIVKPQKQQQASSSRYKGGVRLKQYSEWKTSLQYIDEKHSSDADTYFGDGMESCDDDVNKGKTARNR